jgi:hypothetical protein
VIKMKKNNKKYTVSTFIFDSLQEAKDQVKWWEEKENLKLGTMILEIGEEKYEPVIELNFKKV